jgi:hypothetical protein
MRIRQLELSATIFGAVLALGASQSGCTTSQAEHETSAAGDEGRAVKPAFGAGGGSAAAVKAIVFQAAGPNAASIQSTVDQFRLALGDPNNANAPGPLATGRREINWDGGGSTATALGPTPFDVFLNTRGARMTTPGTGFVQATPQGMKDTFGNATYAKIFQPFSQPRLFSAIGSNLTDVLFFIPGTAGGTAAGTRGFGAVFTDVDQPDGSSEQKPSTSLEYLDANGAVLFSSFVPASPGDGSLSFFGIVLDDDRIARVVITAGNAAPGPDDGQGTDIVMMDDFIYGEPGPVVCDTSSH